MRSKLKTLSCVLAVVLCMTAFSVTAFAADGGYYASNENTTETPPDSIDSIVVGTENVQLPEGGGAGIGEALTPDGNLTLIDDILQAGAFVSDETERAEKQFITVQSNGNTKTFPSSPPVGSTKSPATSISSLKCCVNL